MSENFIDRAIRYVDPIRAKKRMQARAAMAIVGGYSGASNVKRSLSSWLTGNTDADSSVLSDLGKLRSRSRDLVRNSPIATGAISLVVNNTVGTGLKLQSRIDRAYLKIDDEEAELWESEVEREWASWAESQECDCARTLTFNDIQSLAFRQTLENGDAFALMTRFKRGLNPYMLKIQMIEGDRVTNKNNLNNTALLSGGVQKDAYGAPLFYHVLRQHPGAVYHGGSEWDMLPAFNNRTGLRNVIHLYNVLRPGQSRGVPYLAPVIESLKQLERYTEAELMAAVISGMFTVFVETETGQNLPIPAFNPATETAATSSDEDYKLGNGAIVGLAPGEKVSTANPGRPNEAFDPFVTAILRQIGMALEIPYEVLIRHFSSSYSASRAALLESWRFFRCRRAWLQQHFCQPVYENWLTEAVAFGRISAPGYFDDIKTRQAYCGTIWIGDAPGQIDPMKEVNASEKRLNLGLSTLDEETVLLTGGDFERNYPRIIKERRLMEAAGMWQTVQSANAPAPIESAPDKEDDREDT